MEIHVRSIFYFRTLQFILLIGFDLIILIESHENIDCPLEFVILQFDEFDTTCIDREISLYVGPVGGSKGCVREVSSKVSGQQRRASCKYDKGNCKDYFLHDESFSGILSATKVFCLNLKKNNNGRIMRFYG